MNQPLRKPAWLRRPIPPAGRLDEVAASMAETGLYTVCREAACPNRGECFGRGTATVLLLGPHCTRNCRFCNVRSARPLPPRPEEPKSVAETAARLGLKFLVLTMVSRDDLADGGAAQVAATIREVHARLPETGVEALISDLGGDQAALATVIAAGPQVLAHNLETVPRLYGAVRPQADYRRSLAVIEGIARAGLPAKSGLMLGLGEEMDEVRRVLADLRRAGATLLTLGQYLAPSPEHHPVVSYPHPDEFAALKEEALAMGFAAVASGPYVRSSYRAGELYRLASSPDAGA